MNITQIEETVKKLASDVLNSSVKKDQFIYELMAAYGHRKTTVSRIKSGERNLAKGAGEVRAKRHIYFKHSDSNKVFSDIDDMKKEPSVTREKIRFIIATDFNQFVAVDTRTHDTLDIEFGELGKHFDFFLPWAGMEKAVYQGDNPADVKAAEKMARLFDLIKADNFSEENKNDTAALHSLNVFLTRLLFCFFAEDTGIFTDNQFSAELESHTKADGSDVNSYLNRLFEVLNTSKEDRHDLPDYLAKFEYVNGGLFTDDIASPKFSTKSRRMLIECGSELDWSGINPDIFGSMIQAVVHPDQRGGMGMHYTSVINIMKVIEPLFLDDLYAELENIAENIDPKLKPSRLRKLHDRIADIKIFDPACGSGNFLIIAFKELRKLEMEIIRQLQDFKRDESQNDFFDEVSLNSSFSRIKLSQFYGIELDDFAHEVAILSLWLSEHQMNVDFKAEFGECEPSLPLKESGHIIAANATRIDWEQVCPNKGEVYVLGNPPYLGARNQSSEQKEDMKQVFNNRSEYKNSDYVSCWILKASDYIANTKTRFAFVTTSSIAQGEQVSYIWPYVFNNNQEIIFAHQPFKWVNNAKQAAGIICVIIGVSSVTPKAKKILFDSKTYRELNNISPYLTEGSNQVIYGTKENISGLPKMVLGSMARDGGNLILSNEEHKVIVTAYPSSKELFRRFYGSKEFIRGEIRWGLWINDAQLPLALNIPDISNRIKKVYDFRCASKAKTTNQYAKISHKFAQRCLDESQAIIIPRVSSERRDYIPIGFLDKGSIISDSALALYQAEVYMFSLLSSRMHNVWVKAVGGYLGTSIRYSVSVCFNTFILPSLSDTDKENLTNSALKILECREAFPDKTFSELYDPDLMPNSLKQVHAENDSLVEACYRSKEFSSNEERLEYLFSLYGQMTGGPNA